MNKLLKLKTLVGKSQLQAITLVVVMILTAFAETLGISILYPIFDFLLEEESPNGLSKFLNPLKDLFDKDNLFLALLLIFIFLFFLKFIFQMMLSYLIAKFNNQLWLRWQDIIMKRYLYGPYSIILNQKQGILINNLTQETYNASIAISNSLQFLANLFPLFFIYIFLWITNWELTLILSIIGAVIILCLKKPLKSFSQKIGNIRLKLQQQQTSCISESILGMQLIRTYNLEEKTIWKMTQINKKLCNINIQFSVLKRFIPSLNQFVIAIGIFGLLLYYYHATSGDIKSILPQLAIIIISFQRLSGGLSDVLARGINIHLLLPSLFLIYDLTSECFDKEQKKFEHNFSVLTNDILFKNVMFSYEKNNPPVFRDLSVVIPKNKITAFIGPSGVGKSTIVNLLLGFYSPNKGQILINGKELHNYNLHSWREKIAYVSQDTFIFNGTISENIRLGKLYANNKDIVQAAKNAAIDDFISSLPNGYNTQVGDRGIKLSGGQRQRISIARALIRKPELYIFDEATSSLDYKSEALIKTAVDSIKNNKTIIIITHRLNTIENADTIYNLEEIV